MVKKLSRNIKPRAEASIVSRELKKAQEDGPSTSIPSGDYTINPEVSGVRLERFSSIWSNENAKAVFRIWNHLDEKDPENNLYRGRRGSNMDELGGMSIYGPVVVAPFVGIGPKDATFPNGQGQKSTFIITKDAPRVRSLKWKKKLSGVADVLKEGIPFWELPYPSFYDACKSAFKAGKFASGGPRWDSEWNALMDNSDGKANISDMKVRYFMVGHFYELGPDLNTQYRIIRTWDGQRETQISVERHGVPYGLGENDPLVVAWMTGPAAEKVLELCRTLKEEWEGDDEANPALPYKYGDPCGVYDEETRCVNGGLIFTMFNPAMYQPEDSRHSTWDGRIPAKDEISSYQVAVSRGHTTADGTKFSGDMDADATQKIFDKNLYPWREAEDEAGSTLLHESTVEEECVRIAEGFRDVPKLVEFAFTSHPEYLEYGGVQHILLNRTIVSIPDMVESGEDAEDAEVIALERANILIPEQTVETVEQVDDPAVVVSTPAAASTSADDEFEEEVGGEVEAEVASVNEDDEFDEFAQTFVEGSFEEDADDSAEFDPETEADELSESMGESLSKASKALAKSAKRGSPKRKLNPPSQ